MHLKSRELSCKRDSAARLWGQYHWTLKDVSLMNKTLLQTHMVSSSGHTWEMIEKAPPVLSPMSEWIRLMRAISYGNGGLAATVAHSHGLFEHKPKTLYVPHLPVCSIPNCMSKSCVSSKTYFQGKMSHSSLLSQCLYVKHSQLKLEKWGHKKTAVAFCLTVGCFEKLHRPPRIMYMLLF